MNCSALALSGCFAPIVQWWGSIGAWLPLVLFCAGVVLVLAIGGLIRWVTKSDFATFGFLGLVAAIFEYRRGLARKPFNPLPPIPQPTPTPVVPPKPTQRR